MKFGDERGGGPRPGRTSRAAASPKHKTDAPTDRRPRRHLIGELYKAGLSEPRLSCGP
ncbi:hypothetical protein LA76x_3136 [Lysobacter antibioticus]|uniref:Uncharacterized protein n=1 Tax=Lysobacter antibioticus TaxID=84531 RepID=A0A0S2FCM0_LYSAN|nr:hypothetical protein LA76x_3136 [Lysobacter antibioticus]